MILLVIAAFFATECYGQMFDPIACGDTRPNHLVFNDTNPGTISSPYYNQTYPADSLCEWHLQAQEAGQVIELKFFDMEVEQCTSCTCDAIEVYDGATADATLIDTFCGVTTPAASVISTGQDLYVRFRSDATGQLKGFLARYGYIYSTEACTIQRPEVITRPYGSIFSTDWPVDYPDNEFCTWQLQAPAGQRIRITVLEFAFENCCLCDYLEIYDGGSTADPRFGHWYGTGVLPPVIETTSNLALLYWATDVSVTDTGFILTFEHIA